MVTRPAKKIAASEFKAKCLALLDDVARTRITLTVTKRGKPIARLYPADTEEPPDLLGSVRYGSEDELLCPVDEIWEADG